MAEAIRESSWGEYQRLVLAELERHDKLLQTIQAHLQTHDIELSQLKETPQNIRTITLRIDKLEAADIASVAVSKYRGWFLSGFILLAGSIVIPLVKILFLPGG